MAKAAVQEYLKKALKGNASSDSLVWLEEQVEKIKNPTSPNAFFLAFSKASRHFKKEALSSGLGALSLDESGMSPFCPSHWDSLQAARIFLLLQLPQEKKSWMTTVQQLFETADMYEQQALYAALPLLPFAEDMLPRAIEGCRTNMSLVFDAIALNNPYPARFFPETNWNQLVLKAIFMQRPLYQIQQLDARRNPALAAMVIDFAHERWAAGRPVMPEIWRLLVLSMSSSYLGDLKKVLESADSLEQKAGALAAFQSSYLPAKELLAPHRSLQEATASGAFTWEVVGIEFQKNQV
ncbi:MAG: EboA domain-containing protein [Bacteroidetes bacterium]|nr:EboA domain-containing protein [Bacteroidota bacterium]